MPDGAKGFAVDDGSACFGYCCPVLALQEEELEEQVQDHFDMSIF